MSDDNSASEVKRVSDEIQRMTFTDGGCISTDFTDGGTIARMVTHRYAPEYKMNHAQRGLALIFCHENFEHIDAKLQTRGQSENLQRVLTLLDFRVKLYHDLNYADIKRKMKETAKANHTQRDCLLVVIISHGESDLIHAKDQSYKLESIWSAFSADKCSTLAGKPKLFLVETHQIRRRTVACHSLSSRGYTETDGDSRSNYKIPVFADFLIAYCTIPDYVTSSVNSSLFIKNLCAELETDGRHFDFLRLLTFVTQRMADDHQRQIPCIMSSLTRIVRFGDYKRKSRTLN